MCFLVENPLWVSPVTGTFSHTSRVNLTIIPWHPFCGMKEGLELVWGHSSYETRLGKPAPCHSQSPSLGSR